ncbi:hypothetical protein EVG59_01105 [Salmonella enterica subsp. enterica serovar Dortmund]|nr:hypothetical protein [Salmonella enterica subsp. enterica serovar Dortmund]ECB1957889.1 hypothetical protein [Salmonella enterica subsp. enterica serovar Dortmund]EEC0293638.1 hypothetical protein [Salmonella enterica subsp. enterica]
MQGYSYYFFTRRRHQIWQDRVPDYNRKNNKSSAIVINNNMTLRQQNPSAHCARSDTEGAANGWRYAVTYCLRHSLIP